MQIEQTERQSQEATWQAGSSQRLLGTGAESASGNGQSRSTAYRLAQGLGWFSIGLGLAELLAPRDMARLIGAKGDSRTYATLRALGVREILSGVGILSRTQDPKWVWSRLGGDLMDVALLKTELASSRSERTRGLAATAAVLGVAAVDGFTALKLSKETSMANGVQKAITVTASITIQRSRQDVYRFWHDFTNLPQALSFVESVRVEGDRSHWRAKLPGGLSLEWSAQTEDDRPDELISWRSLPGGLLQNHGRVSFRQAPGDQGTEVHVTLGFEALGGAVGAAFAKMLGALPAQQLRADLRRVKQILETGALTRSDATIHHGPHPARPSRTEKRDQNAERGSR